jgi:pantothenate kinase
MPGSGKSTLASAWAAEANRRLGCPPEAPAIVALGMDGFHIPKARLRQMPQGEHALLRRGAPWTFDAHALRANVLRLAQQIAPDSIAARGHLLDSKGQISSQSPDPVTWPGFEHGVGDPVPDAIRVAPSARVILVEGLYLLHHGDGWHCRDLFDEAWAIDVPTALARARTVARHMAANGNTAQQAQARWHGNDRLNAAVVRKSARHAQFRVDNPDRIASTEPKHEH